MVNFEVTSTESLRRRKIELEYLGFMQMVETATIGDGIEDELAELSGELRRRGFEEGPPVAWTDYLGIIMESGQTLDDVVAEGPFSFICAGKGSSGQPSIFKIAKAASPPDPVLATARFPTRAAAMVDGTIRPVRPDGNTILQMQAVRIKSDTAGLFARVRSLSEIAGALTLELEPLPGITLRQKLSSPEFGADRAGEIGQLAPLLAALARSLAELFAQGHFAYHGDLKPENIMVTDAGLRLIDPGYFGPLPADEGVFANAMVTTPEYYPSATADDIFAFGVTLFEVLVGVHPLSPADAGEPGESRLARKFRGALKGRVDGGLSWLAPLLSMRPPAAFEPSLSAPVSDLLLKALRLRQDRQGFLREDEGFASFAEVADAIENVMTGGAL